jgi:hypothetical protein
VDNASCVIVGVQATAARLSQESAAARDMIERYRERYGYRPQTLAADNTYGNGEFLQWLDDHGIAPYIRVKENPNGPTDLYGIDQFTYVPEENCYICREGKRLNTPESISATALTFTTPRPSCVATARRRAAAREASIGSWLSTPVSQPGSVPMP